MPQGCGTWPAVWFVFLMLHRTTTKFFISSTGRLVRIGRTRLCYARIQKYDRTPNKKLQDYVNQNPSAFVNAYFTFNSLTIYE
ncbi:hypothetical protein ID866_8209 [Astraeus odoratus]|nr:hypothetical protein ID866_8209 [Astraeus odoratus]